MTDYLLNVIGAEKNDIYFSFMVVSLTGPTSGAIFGGFFGKWIGGPTSPLAMPSMFVIGLFALCVGLPIPFFNSLFWVVFFVWLYYFCGGFMVPILTFCMINSVEPELKSKANAIANLSYYVLGYFPAPVIYGCICDLSGGKTSRWGFICTFNLNWITLILMTIA